MKAIRFNLRDLLWLTVVVGLAVGWWSDHRRDGRTMISGVVTDTNNSDLVEISLGSDDGLKNGDIMEVRRGPNFIGEGIVLKVGPDRAVLRMKARKRLNIQKDDTVTTKVALGARLD